MMQYVALENTEVEATLENYYAFELLDSQVEDPRAPNLKRARLSSLFFKEVTPAPPISMTSPAI